jgi:hypothetical protein
MRELDGTVLRSMNDERTREIMATEEGQGMLQMLMAEWPWETFVTLTTTEVCSPERMKKIIFKTFGMNRITKGCKYFFVLEPFKNREGVHAHLLVKDMPPYPSWKHIWDWYHNKKGYGRFQSLKINGTNMMKVCAYCTKYCLKEVREGMFGWSTTITGRRHHDHNDYVLGPQKTGSKIRSVKSTRLIRENVNWKASGHHRRQRNVYGREGIEKLNGLEKLRRSLRGETEWNAISEAVRLESEATQETPHGVSGTSLV